MVQILHEQSGHPTSDPKINKLLANLNSERKNLQGAQAYIRALQASSKNEAVIQQAHNEVRNAQANIKFLEDELSKMQISGGGSGASSGPGSPGRSASAHNINQSSSRSSAANASSGHGASGSIGSVSGYPQGPPGSQQGGIMGPRGYSTPHLTGAQTSANERPLPPPPPGAGAGGSSAVVRQGTMQGGATKNITQLGEFW